MYKFSRPVTDVSIIVAIENIGPLLKGSTSQDMISNQNEANVVLYFTQRVIFSLGFGNEQVEFKKFHGPLTLIKTKSDKGLILPIKFIDNNSTDTRINQFGRDVVFVIHFLEKDYKLIQNFQGDLLVKSLKEIEDFCPDFKYRYLDDEENIMTLVKKMKKKLNRFLSLRLWAEEQGSSLLHLGTLKSLEGAHREIGALLVGFPAGLSLKEIEDKVNVKIKNEIEATLQDLKDMGYIEGKRYGNDNLRYIIR